MDALVLARNYDSFYGCGLKKLGSRKFFYMIKTNNLGNIYDGEIF